MSSGGSYLVSSGRFTVIRKSDRSSREYSCEVQTIKGSHYLGINVDGFNMLQACCDLLGKRPRRSSMST